MKRFWAIPYYEVIYDCLYHRMKAKSKRNRGPSLQIVIPSGLRREIMRRYHDEFYAGHVGVTQTWKRLNRRFWWPNMFQDIYNYVGSCVTCNTARARGKQNRVPLQKNIAARGPFDVWAVDTAGPFKRSVVGNAHMVVFVCLYTKWVEAFAVPDIESNTILKYLVNEIICRYGAPRVLLSDRGTSLISSLAEMVYDICNITKMNTTAYHPEANGQAESSVKNIKQKIKKFMKPDQSDWDEQLPKILASIRNDINFTLDESPFAMVFGKDMILTPDHTILKEWDPPRGLKNREQIKLYRRELARQLKEIRQNADNNLKEAFRRYKKYYDLKVQGHSYCVGERVWLWFPQNKPSMINKLLHRWHGPYTILEKVGEVSYRLELSEHGRRYPVVHFNRLRPVFKESLRPITAPLFKIGDEEELTEMDLPASSMQVSMQDQVELLQKGEYLVAALIDKRISKAKRDGQRETEYLVRWQGYGAESDSWVRYSDLRCEDLVRDFEERYLQDQRFRAVMRESR